MRRMSTLLCGCLAACSLSCAVKKPPSMPEILKQGLPETTKARDQWAAPSGVSGPVEYGWLKGFADPQMEAVVEEVLRTNRDLRLSATRVEVAAGLATQARAMVLTSRGASRISNSTAQGFSGRLHGSSTSGARYGRSRPRPRKVTGQPKLTSGPLASRSPRWQPRPGIWRPTRLNSNNSRNKA